MHLRKRVASQSLSAHECVVSTATECCPGMLSENRSRVAALRRRPHRGPHIMIARVAAAIAVSASLGFAPARAADPFGTAGSFRTSGWEQCGAPIKDLLK